MSATPLLMDTGPLVALLDRSDHHHAWAVSCFTVDSDFKVYRRHGRAVIPLLAPWMEA